jgi:SAM-dependent methyltransferase
VSHRVLDISAGRAIFGEDPAAYHAARPPYPEALYARLVERADLAPGTPVFEVGPGTGLATARLLALGAAPLLAIEPDARLAAFLAARLADPALEIIAAPFDEAHVPPARFALGVAATSFHWLDQPSALAKARRSLRPGGWWAMWWTNFGDAETDLFREATRHLFSEAPRSPSHGRPDGPPFALDREARLADLARAGLEPAEVDFWPWTETLETSRLRALYATYSPIQALPPDKRARLLDGVAAIAERDFGGKVERPFSTILYMARRP